MQVVLCLPALSQRDNMVQVGFTPDTAMISDAQANLTVTGTGQHSLLERLTNVTDMLLLQEQAQAPPRANIHLAVPSNFPPYIQVMPGLQPGQIQSDSKKNQPCWIGTMALPATV